VSRAKAWNRGSYVSAPNELSTIFNLGSAESVGDQLEGWNFTAVGPSGDVVNISGSVEVNDAEGDCVFSITVIGP
jgi:hypothetical protein